MTKHPPSTTSMSCLAQTIPARVWALMLVGLAIFMPSRSMASSEPAHCRALRAQANSTAAVLELPRLELQGLHSPVAGDLEGSTVLNHPGYQARAGIAWSAIGLLRAQSLRAAALAECERWSATQEIELVLAQGTSYGRAEALRVQIESLEAGAPRVSEIVEEARARFDRSLITILEVNELELRRLSFETELEQLRHELGLLDSQKQTEEAGGLDDALARYEQASKAFEREQARNRRLAAWRLEISGGVVPFPEPDWFGVVSVGWSFGGLAQVSAEAEAKAAQEEARASELNELRPRTEKFMAAMAESVARLNDELVLIDRQLELHTKRLAERPESERLRQAFAALEIGEIELRGRRAYVERLRSARDAVGSLQP